jgi:hypothetical protein
MATKPGGHFWLSRFALGLAAHRGGKKALNPLINRPNFIQGLQHVALLGVAFGSRPGLDGQIEPAYIFPLGKQSFFHQDTGETVGQGQRGLAQDTGLYGG